MPPITPFVSSDEDGDEDGSFTRSLVPDVDDSSPAPVVVNRAVPPPAAAPDDDALPQAPVYKAPDAAAMKAVTDKLAADQVRTDPNAPGIKPSLLRRIAGSLAAGAMAYDHIPDALQTGNDAIYSKFNAAEAARQGRVAADQQQLAALQASNQQNDQDYNRALTGYKDNIAAYGAATARKKQEALEQQRLGGVDENTLVPDDPKNPLGTWHGSNLRGEPVTGVAAPDKFLKTPEGVMAVRQQEADKLSLAGDDRKYYMANGKLAEPKPVTNIRVPRQPSEGEQAYSDAQASWRAEHPGKTPGLSDLRAIRAAADGRADVGEKTGTPNQFAAVTKNTQDAYRKAQASYEKAIEDDPSATGRAEAAAELKRSNDSIAAENSQRTRDLGGIPREDAAPAAAPAAPARPAQAQAVVTQKTKQQVKPGDSVTVNGKQYRVAGINPQTGKPILSQ